MEVALGRAVGGVSSLFLEARAVWLGTLIIAVSGAVALVILATAKYGPALSPDSVFYLTTAQHFSAGQGLYDFAAQPLSHWPPGFPMLVGAASKVLGVSVRQAARIVNVVSLAGIVLAAGVLLRRHIRSRILQTLGIAAAATAPPLILVATYAWSEPFFIAACLASVVCAERALDAGSGGAPWALLSGLCAGAAFATRYVGVCVCIALAPLLIWQGRQVLAPRVRMLRTAAFVLPVAAAIAAVAAHNLSAGEPAFGTPGSPIGSFTEQLRSTGNQLATWLVPRFDLSHGLRDAIAGAIAILVLALVVRRARRGSPRARRGFPSGAAPVMAFAASYLIVLEASSTRVWVSLIDARLLSPLFIPVLVLGLMLAEMIIARAPRPHSSIGLAGVATVVIALIWTVLSGLQGTDVARAMRNSGGGYTTYRWRHSALAQAVRSARPAVGTVYTNAPDALWAITGLDARCPPRDLRGTGCDIAPSIWGKAPNRRPPTGTVELAWFRSTDPSTEPFAQVADQLSVQLPRRYGDGVLASVQVK